MTDSKVHDEPSDVAADEGEVIVEGPGGINYSMTPEAAETTAERLTDEAVVGRGQRHLRRLPANEAKDRDR